MQSFKSHTVNSAIIGIYNLLLGVVTIATLYFGQVIIIPLALACLLSFLLSGLVTRLEKWFGRVISVVMIVFMVFISISLTSYVMTRQVMELATKLPDYKSNIAEKLRSLHISEDGALTRLFDTIEELKKELPGRSNTLKSSNTLNPPSVPVKLVETPTDFTTAETFFGMFFSTVRTTGFVLLLAFFMLVNREDLRGRMIRLIGQGKISSTMRAIDDASGRISHYLFMQLIVNVIFGVLAGISLYFIGIPNAVLWGGLATLLRFIPYIGVWIAAIIPIILSFAVSASWALPLITICVFVGLEFFICNMLEIWLYGTSIGVRPMALIVAGVFWTWLWGPVGLVLSTSLTVCFVVIGHYVAKLEFLTILLGDEEPLTPDEECYHRLLAADQNEAFIFIEKYLKTHSPLELYDQVLIPVMVASETDRRLNLIDSEQSTLLRQSIQEMIEDVCTTSAVVTNEANKLNKKPLILNFPIKTSYDYLVSEMFIQSTKSDLFDIENIPLKRNIEDLVVIAEQRMPSVICVIAASLSNIMYVRNLCLKLVTRSPQSKIVVCIWGSSEISTDNLAKLESIGVENVVLTLSDAILACEKLSKADE